MEHIARCVNLFVKDFLRIKISWWIMLCLLKDSYMLLMNHSSSVKWINCWWWHCLPKGEVTQTFSNTKCAHFQMIKYTSESGINRNREKCQYPNTIITETCTEILNNMKGICQRKQMQNLDWMIFYFITTQVRIHISRDSMSKLIPLTLVILLRGPAE